ncbi:ROK family protein [Planosporangium thailandense]|uniref:ROK family protein n=1 Tax=Planosporangium thailandense TaxID=765197 RepID=A0ABX0XZW4_9ACTN|nr:ROK family transcriptional regulator [Planosporangium thailandense]NJC70745.1 ROK family protein [Planosporangium thailandense]
MTTPLRLVATGAADSRADLARLSGLSPSTVSQRVEALIAQDLLREAGAGKSRGGRRPRQLEVPTDAAIVAALDLGAHHARIAAHDLSGQLITAREVDVEIGDGPVPGWNGFDVHGFCVAQAGVPVAVDNDANLMALGEHRWTHPDLEHAIYVKAGTGIGSGVIAAGRLHRGAQGSAGDISHCRVTTDPTAQCSCGNTGCLEAVASGAALVDALRARGLDVSHPRDVTRLAQDGDAAATSITRAAGRAIGEILAVVVNFFNPQAVVIGGVLAECEPLLASMRASLYERSLPFASQALTIERCATGVDAGVLGAAQLVLDHILDAV